MAEDPAGALATGLQLAAQFNPLFAFVGAVAAAMLAGHRDASRNHTAWGVGIVLATWLVGDGARVLARTRDVYDGLTFFGPQVGPASAYAALATWALGGLALGYVLPAWAGAFTGRRVTRGTGWLAAGAVAAAISVAVAALAGTAG